MITQSYNLDVVPGGAPVVVHCHQNDITARAFSLVLYSRNGVLTIPSGATAYIEGEKPDGHSFSYAANLNGLTVTIDLREQMTVLAGDVRCQCKIVSGAQVLISANFILRVAVDITANTDMSETEVPGLVQQAQAAAEAAEEAAQNINANWFINGVKTTPIDTYTTTSKLTDGAINELKGNTDANAALIAALKTSISPSPTDMNDTSLVGFTALLNAGTVANLPTSTSGHYYKVLCLGPWQIASRYVNGGDSRMYQREYVNSTWNSWMAVHDSNIELESTTTYGLSVSARKNGNVVVVMVSGTTSEELATSAGYVDLMTLPEGMRPPVQMTSREWVTISLNGAFQVNTNGTIRLSYTGYPNGSGGRIAASVPSGATVYLTMTYIVS